MTIEIKAPAFPESVAEGVVASWNKKSGDLCQQDELLVEIETDKVVLEIASPVTGVLKKIIKNVNDTVQSQEIIGLLDPSEHAVKGLGMAAHDVEPKKGEGLQDRVEKENILSPAARKAVQELEVNQETLVGTGKDGRITKADVVAHAKQVSILPVPSERSSNKADFHDELGVVGGEAGGRLEKRVPMTRLRRRVAQRLLEAQQTAAMLTTFNEVNLEPVMQLRHRYKEMFEKQYGVRLGFMSFFVKAAVEGLRRFPVVNASIDGDDVVYHGYQDIGVAVSSDKGLVVPILRNVEYMGLAEIEKGIREFGAKAQTGKLTIEEMTGGTFTISNGGVFGSMLSTPILNPPQSAILGMHAIKDRAVVEKGEMVVRPMMYLALSYDHRLLDGKDAVLFLVTLKELLEDPARMLLGV